MAVDMGSAVAYLMLDASNFNTALQGAANSLTTTGASMASAGAGMTATITKGLISLGQTAVEKTATFESAMSQVQATMNIGKEATQDLDGELVNVMDSLGDLAKQLGGSTKFTATEAAEAINNMAMAGYSVQQTYDALPTVLSLASAGALDLDYATQLVANGLNVMGMETKDATELADKLAVTASNAYGSVSDFGEGLLVAGGQAKIANVSLTDTMTALGILGDNGISASEGGTMLRNTLKNLYTPTTDAQKALKELGIETKTADGNIVGLQEVLISLGGALDELTDAQRIEYMGRIFDTRTIAGANALLSNATDRWDELSAVIDQAGGAADRMAATQLDNLNGQLTILSSSVEALFISFGEIMLPVIKQVAETIQSIVDWLNSLDESQKQLIMRITVVIAAIGPLMIVAGRLLAMIGQMSSGVSLMSSLALGKIALITAAIVGLIALIADLYQNNEEFRTSINGMLSGLKDSFDTLVSRLRNVWERLQPIVEIFEQRIAGPLSEFLDAIGSIVSTIIENVGSFVELLADKFGELLESGWIESVTESIAGIVETLGEIIDYILPKLIDLISEILDQLDPVFKIVDNVLKAIDEIVKQFEPFIEQVVDMIQRVIGEMPLEEFLQSVSELVESILNIIVESLPVVIELLEELLPIVESLLEVLSPVLSLVSDVIGLIANLLQMDFEGAGDRINNIFGDIGNIFTSLWNVVSTTFAQIGLIISNAANAIIGFFEPVGKFFTETIPNWFSDLVENVKKWFEELPYNIGYALGEAARAFVQFGVDVLNWIENDLPEIINSIVEWFKNLPEELSNAIKDMIDGVIQWGKDMKKNFEDAFDKIKTFLSNIDLTEIGKDILNTLFDGLKDVWTGIQEWFNGLKLNWDKFTSGVDAGLRGKSAGSYATGLEYVPRTMDVTVHRGERILTQQENEEYNKGGSIEFVSYQNDEAINKLNETMTLVLNEVSELRNMKISLDGKRLVGGLINETDRQLGMKMSVARG